jgi:hypothetical protein
MQMQMQAQALALALPWPLHLRRRQLMQWLCSHHTWQHLSCACTQGCAGLWTAHRHYPPLKIADWCLAQGKLLAWPAAGTL